MAHTVVGGGAYVLYLHGRVVFETRTHKQNRLIDPAKPTLRVVVLGLSAPLTGYFNLRIVTPPPLTTTFAFRKQSFSCATVSVREGRGARTERRTKAVGSEERRRRYGFDVGESVAREVIAHCISSIHACFPSSASPRRVSSAGKAFMQLGLNGCHYLRQGASVRAENTSTTISGPQPYPQQRQGKTRQQPTTFHAGQA